MSTTRFKYETGEIDTHEGVWLTGDFLLDVETDDDGASFKLVDVISMRRQITGTLRTVVDEWFEGDTAPRFKTHDHKSLIRKAYDNHMADLALSGEHDDGQSYAYTAPREHRSIFVAVA